MPGRMEDPLSEWPQPADFPGRRDSYLCGRTDISSWNFNGNVKKKKNNITLASSENMVYICSDFRPKSLTEIIIRSSGLPAEAVMRILMDLQ